MSATAAQLVGQRIREARVWRGWSQGDLAARLGRTQTAVSYWEGGRRSLGVDELVEVAEALDVPVSDLLPDSTHRRPVTVLLRAAALRLDATQLADELERFAESARDLPRPEARWQITGTTPRDTAESLLAAADITTPPIRVEELVADCGIIIQPWNFVDDVDGLMVNIDSGPVIWVNRHQAPTRQRFTLAHELGHKLLRHFDQFHVEFGGDLSPSATGGHPDYDWRAERAANDFAANLLMPAVMVRDFFPRAGDVRDLAATFEVSPAAMGYRLTNLGLTLHGQA
jgi:Zn-dependent peptidase ImmA (M78 family)/DNA-binding XRE family transcriptional regulator